MTISRTAGPNAVLNRLQLTVSRRLDGLLQGDYLGLLPGPGSEAGESREYVPGDDVRRMDWPVTARTTVPHVRLTVADRELETWLAVDLSPSQDFGTAAMLKRDLAVTASAAITHLTVRGGNRVGAVIACGAGTFIRRPARGGRPAAQALLRTISAAPRTAHAQSADSPPSAELARPAGLVGGWVRPAGSAGGLAGPGGSAGGLARPGGSAGPGACLRDLIEALNWPPRRRGLAVVVSDFLEAPPGWERPLRRLAVRHDVLAIEILDPRELELPDVGVLELADPETGAVHTIQTSDRRLRQRYAQAATAQREDIADTLRESGARHLRLRTDSDWLQDLVKFVVGQRHRRGR